MVQWCSLLGIKQIACGRTAKVKHQTDEGCLVAGQGKLQENLPSVTSPYSKKMLLTQAQFSAWALHPLEEYDLLATGWALGLM